MGLIVNRFRPSVVTTTADFLFNWAHRYSMWPLILGTACCAIEMMAVGISRFDMLGRRAAFERTPDAASAHEMQ
mgnify:CR=1 FL=1